MGLIVPFLVLIERLQPLEPLYYFAKVVEHGGYARAARALSIPKSRLSRQVSALEARFGVRLVQRSTRRFVVTELGREVHRHALAMLAEADAAAEAIEAAQAQPRGLVRIACPVALAQTALARVLPVFLERYPALRVQVHVDNRRVDLLNEGIDLALRVRSAPSGEDGIVLRRLRPVAEILVATPGYLATHGRPARPADLAAGATLGYAPIADSQVWEFTDRAGQVERVEHRPRLVAHDFRVLRAAVLRGLGIALLPESIVRRDLERGELERLLPAWEAPSGVVHLAFPTRRGLLPGVRALIDFLAEVLPAAL